jgi:ABC-type amino acid transport substrate-binding protein
MKGLLAATLALALIAPSTAAASAKPETISCTKFSKQVKKTTGAKKKTAQAQLKRCKATNSANRKAFALIKGTTWVGTRGDGAAVAWTFCASGAYTSRTTSGGSTGTVEGSSYRVAEAVFKGKDFTAHIVDKRQGFSIAVARTKGQFQVGVARSFGEVEKLGPATRSAAGC